jgi:hypothetical protein
VLVHGAGEGGGEDTASSRHPPGAAAVGIENEGMAHECSLELLDHWAAGPRPTGYGCARRGVAGSVLDGYELLRVPDRTGENHASGVELARASRQIEGASEAPR